jgi:hypothetical protein
MMPIEKYKTEPRPITRPSKRANGLLIALVIGLIVLALALGGTIVALVFVLRDTHAETGPHVHEYWPDYTPAPVEATPPAPSTTASTTKPLASTTTTTWTAPTPTEDVGAPPNSGSYYNEGGEGPHYIVSLSVPSHGRVNGTVTFQGQNGSLSNELTFSGTTRFGVAAITTSTGHNLTMGYNDSGIDFGFGCIGVFRFVESHAQCMFQKGANP